MYHKKLIIPDITFEESKYEEDLKQVHCFFLVHVSYVSKTYSYLNFPEIKERPGEILCALTSGSACYAR